MRERTLTTGQIAKYCRVNYQTVIRWIKRGRMKAHQLPGRGDHRVEVEDFLDFLKKNDLPIPIDLVPGGKRVVIVDDDPSMTRAIQRILKKEGYETAIASNGFEAGVLFKTFGPHLITLDLQMPGLDGIDVIRHVRESEHDRSIKILVVSGMESPHLQEAVEAGADECLQKPFKSTALVETVQRLIGSD